MAEKDVKLKAAGLWQKTSAKGHTYYVGRWGGVKILILPNNDRQGEDEPSHLLFIAEAPDRKPKGPRATGPGRQSRRETEGFKAPNDDISDLWK